MKSVKIKTGFRFGGKYYSAKTKPVSMDEVVAKFAIENGYAVDFEVAAKVNKKANKDQGNAPENK